VPDFEIETLLGSGTGTTYLARAADGTLLGVKELGAMPPDETGALDDLRDALLCFQHPNVARTIALDAGDDGVWRLMRAYVPGRAWDRADAGTRRAARPVLEGAIAAIHDAGFAHGNLTAPNIVWGAQGIVMLDAGARLARALAGHGGARIAAAQREDLAQLDALF
jgi:hypothetical protein